MHRLVRRFTLPVVAALVLAVSHGAALAQKTVTAEAGQTRVTLAPSFVSALNSLGVKPGVVGPTHLYSGVANFPIVGGAIDLDTAKGQILHSGGLTLTAGGTVVKLQSFIVDTTGNTPVLTGLVVVNNALVGRIPLFDLVLPPGFSVPLHTTDGLLVLNNVGLTLRTNAAIALNSVFHITALHDNLVIGTAKVTAVPAGYGDDDDE